MRKLFTIGFLAALGLAGSVQAALQDGTYEVSAKGNNGPVVFSVEIQGQAIKSIKVVRGEETPGLGVEAIAMISREITFPANDGRRCGLGCDEFLAGCDGSGRSGSPKSGRNRCRSEKDASDGCCAAHQ